MYTWTCCTFLCLRMMNTQYMFMHWPNYIMYHIYCNTNALWSLTYVVTFIKCASSVYSEENVYHGSIYTPSTCNRQMQVATCFNSVSDSILLASAITRVVVCMIRSTSSIVFQGQGGNAIISCLSERLL